ncbi:centromere protein S [Syngnathoides biaculeatus]|uniref:centromere protein S n=1 Tax=Syngnathoides biaculeatus TaxID=300417 RepID=UPI002ADE5275|nr:centromere protein S [Syngnathoides biaculeatus]
MSLSEDETRQRLKAAVHYTVARMCQKMGEEQSREFSRQAVAAIAETAFRQCDIFAKDLEAFAKHAKRCTVSAEDVKLLARRSTALSVHIQKKSEEVEQEQKAFKKKRKSKESDQSKE